MMMPWQLSLEKVIRSWQGTPWLAGQQCRGPRGGVDCVHFVVAVLDELHGLSLPPIKRLPQDMSLHDRSGAIRVAKEIAGRYPNRVLDLDNEPIEPGDVLVKQLGEEGGPGHVLIAGCQPGELWHSAMNVGVVRTGVGVAGKIMMAWRPTEREQWHS